LKVRVAGWGVPAGSVLEMEVLQRAAPRARFTFLAISALELNENYLADFRADIVPFGEALAGLWSVRAD
jgi:hypothetical protein